MRLETAKVGGRHATSWPAVVRFVAAQQPAGEPAPAPQSPAQRSRASERAAAELERLGL